MTKDEEHRGTLAILVVLCAFCLAILVEMGRATVIVLKEHQDRQHQK